MIGIVLCGGKSTRMGQDKGRINSYGINWAQASINTLSVLKIPVYISVNKTQLEDYSKIYGKNNLIPDKEELQLFGPISGIISAHLQFPIQDIFVLACDMQLMKRTAITALYQAYQTNLNQDAFIYRLEDNREPLCGIYSYKALSKISTLYADGIFKKYSMNYILDQLNVCELSIKEEEKKYFKNFNAPTDL